MEGIYSVEVETDSSMFRMDEAILTVKDGKMTAHVTMAGQGFIKLFMGTGEEAETADESLISNYIDNGADEPYSFDIEISEIGKEIECTGFSKKKETWYDHKIIFLSNSLISTAEVTMEGGSGKASIESPAEISFNNGVYYATIVWSSSNYDYMLVDGEKYIPVSSSGNSTFIIPVLSWDEGFEVVGDTIAMSEPHEITYTLTFKSGLEIEN